MSFKTYSLKIFGVVDLKISSRRFEGISYSLVCANNKGLH